MADISTPANIKVTGSKTSGHFGICYVPVDRTLVDGLSSYLRFIRTLYYGDYTKIRNGMETSLFVTHCSSSRPMRQPNASIEE